MVLLRVDSGSKIAASWSLFWKAIDVLLLGMYYYFFLKQLKHKHIQWVQRFEFIFELYTYIMHDIYNAWYNLLLLLE